MKSRSLLIILDGPPSLLLLLFSLFFLYNIDFADDSENYNFKYIDHAFSSPLEVTYVL